MITTKIYSMIMNGKRMLTIIGIVLLILLIPLIGMQISDGVNWSLSDFIIAGVLLLTTGLSSELVIQNVKKKEIRNTLIIVLIMALLLIWIELAVGIFGSPLSGS
ncbi:MAG: hypothetical protein R2785_10155 [Flavobacteriaceae bacterium]